MLGSPANKKNASLAGMFSCPIIGSSLNSRSGGIFYAKKSMTKKEAAIYDQRLGVMK
jgi:hypothetical protein